MTAEVLSLDNPRVSARAEVPDDRWLRDGPDEVLGRKLDWLRRQVRRKADETFGEGSARRSTIWVTYEEIFEPPETAPAA